MKLEIFEDNRKRDVIKVDSSPQDLDVDSKEFSFCDNIHLNCNFQRDVDIVSLQCEVWSRVRLECSRCLDEFERDIKEQFSLVARRLRKGEILPDYSENEGDDEKNLIIVEHNTNVIDVTDFVRDAVIFSIPFNPACKESCKGLCSICGNNLNIKECGCKQEKINSAWKDLSGLFDK